MHIPTRENPEKIEALATYLAHGVEPKAAGLAVGFSASRVSQLLQEESFQLLVAQKTEEIAALYIDTNRMYDKMEQTALRNLLEHLKFNKDPDLSLKIAMLSNRATRRGTLSERNRVLNAQRADTYVHLDFSFNLINKVQNGEKPTAPAIEGDTVAQEIDFASPAMVERILHATKGAIVHEVSRPDDGVAAAVLADYFTEPGGD